MIHPTRTLSIAEAADATGLTAYTLRYYEKIGLIAQVARAGGVRRYSEADMRWLEFLVRLRATGMPMRDMQKYAELLREGPGIQAVAERQALLERHAERVEGDLRLLGETLDYIRKKIKGYEQLRMSSDPPPSPVGRSPHDPHDPHESYDIDQPLNQERLP